MAEALRIYDAVPLSVAEIKAQVQIIQQVLAEIMVKDVHYGTIPGTNKPTLYKPGSEKILTSFHIGVDPREEISDLSTADTVRYRVAVKGFSQGTGNLIGVGIGECSSDEEKYKWRRPVCDEEFNETPENRRRQVWKKGNPNYQQKQVRTNPADVANTVLKMAKKRAQIDMTLTATAASDIFDQDLEDMPEELREGMTGNGHNGQQHSKTSTVKPGKDKKDPEDTRTAKEKLKDELAAYCGPDTGAQNVILKECSKFVGEDQKERYIMVHQIDKAKDGWIGSTIGKLREYVKAHPKEEAKPEEAKKEEPKAEGGLPEWCCGVPEECDAHRFAGDNRFCDNDIDKPVPCTKPLRGYEG